MPRAQKSKALSDMERKLLKYVIVNPGAPPWTKKSTTIFHHFSGQFTQTKNFRLDLGGGSKNLTNSFPKFFNEKFNRCPVLTKHKIKRLEGLTRGKLIIKGTFRYASFVIVMIEKWFDHHFFRARRSHKYFLNL